MGQPNFARAERAELCDLLDAVGPDQPTLCEGWTTRDLAAHLLVRDRRPDASLATVIKPFAGHADNVRRAVATGDFSRLVERVRRPSPLSLAGPPFLDRMVNTVEYFVHHEDVRRGVPGWTRRTLPRRLDDALLSQMRLLVRLRLRRYPASLTITSPGYPPITSGVGGPAVTVGGEPGELTMFFAGRQRAAQVEIDGPPEAAGGLRTARFAI
jgi:uncharacterized protein (TIGR03085 family)